MKVRVSVRMRLRVWVRVSNRIMVRNKVRMRGSLVSGEFQGQVEGYDDCESKVLGQGQRHGNGEGHYVSQVHIRVRRWMSGTLSGIG